MLNILDISVDASTTLECMGTTQLEGTKTFFLAWAFAFAVEIVIMSVKDVQTQVD